MVISFRKKYFGDKRKITQDNSDSLSFGNRLNHLKSQLFNKFKNAINPFYYILNAKWFFI